jgi:hypothetical protein
MLLLKLASVHIQEMFKDVFIIGKLYWKDLSRIPKHMTD